MSVVCVVGGGLAGLAAAHYSLRLATTSRVVVLEASTRLGGWVRTTRHDDGVIYEAGPRTVRPAGVQGANTLALVQELGLADLVRPVPYGSPSASTRLVLADGALHKLPSSLWSVFRTLPPFTRPLAMAVVRDLLTQRLVSEDESLHSFVSRRLGPELAEFAVDPLVRGICAGDIKQISVHFIASYLHSLEQRAGRVSLGAARDRLWGDSPAATAEELCDLVRKARAEQWAVWGLAGGLETLVTALGDSLVSRGVEVRRGAGVVGLERREGGRMEVLTDQESVTCDRLVLATPAFNSSSILQPLCPPLAAALASIPFVDVALTNLEYSGRDVQGRQGFGFLVPSSQPEPILGCIFDTCTFPQGARTILTVMQGGAWYRQMVGARGEQEVAGMAEETVARLLGITARPVRTATSLLPSCIAQYTVGHRARVAEARGLLAGLAGDVRLTGSSYDGVGINDTIVSAKKVATAVL